MNLSMRIFNTVIALDVSERIDRISQYFHALRFDQIYLGMLKE